MQKVSGWWVVAAFVVFVGTMVLAQDSSSARARRAEKRLADLERQASEVRAPQPGPDNPFPIFSPYPKHLVDDEVDLWHKRLTFQTRNEPRRAR